MDVRSRAFDLNTRTRSFFDQFNLTVRGDARLPRWL
jgi:hypothetical protein